MSDSESISIKTISSVANPIFDIVFLHGLNGEQLGTWKHENGEVWPNWLVETFPDAGIHLVGYGASKLAKLKEIELDLHERAESILQHLLLDEIGSRPFAMVCHSLGGITAKEMLRIASESADEEWACIAQNAELIVFFATPHRGAALANLARAIIPRVTSTHTELLSGKSGYLAALSKSYAELSTKLDFKTEAFYEKHKLGKGAASTLVVDESSADPGVTDCRPVPLEANHIEIVKFDSRKALGYRSTVRLLTRTFKDLMVQAGQSAFALNGFSDRHPTDRRDLLQKLIDAGRQHEYEKANERQTAFAIRYRRLGLHEEAKLKSDKLLSEVQQRFTDHVYHGKICKGASDDDIADALQNKVIDPVCEKYGENGDVNPTSVQEAIYYLTQACHIRWDAAK